MSRAGGADIHSGAGRPQSLATLHAPGPRATSLEEGWQVPRGAQPRGQNAAVSGVCGQERGLWAGWLTWVAEQTH